MEQGDTTEPDTNRHHPPFRENALGLYLYFVTNVIKSSRPARHVISRMTLISYHEWHHQITLPTLQLKMLL